MDNGTEIQTDANAAYEALFGGNPLSVLVANHKTRTMDTVKVFVRQLPIGVYQQAFAAHENEEELAALFVSQDVQWVQRLHPSSFNEIITQGRKLNADFFAYCDRRTADQLANMRLVAPEMVEKIAMKALAKSGSPS